MPAPSSSPAPSPARLAVLISGGGRTLTNLHDRIRDGSLPASIELVIASTECPGAERARQRGLNVQVLRGVIPAPQLQELLNAHGVQWVVLAGYLKFVNIPPAFRARVVNIHPALLPKFGGRGMYGHHVHEAVLAAGEKESGCTVHLVDDQYDHGGVVLQRSCPVFPDDTPGTLAARVFELECRAYPEAIRMLLARPQATECRPASRDQ